MARIQSLTIVCFSSYLSASFSPLDKQNQNLPTFYSQPSPSLSLKIKPPARVVQPKETQKDMASSKKTRKLQVVSPVPADIDIANSVEPFHISEIAQDLNLSPNHYDLYGKYKAKVIPSLPFSFEELLLFCFGHVGSLGFSPVLSGFMESFVLLLDSSELESLELGFFYSIELLGFWAM